MGLLDTLGEIAGAVVAVEALEKVNPNASLITKAAAAVGGVKGASELQELVEKFSGHESQDADQAS